MITIDAIEETPVAKAKDPSDLPLRIDAKTLAKFLGIGVGSAYQLLRKNGFPSVHVTRRRRIVYRDALLRYLDNGGPGR